MWHISPEFRVYLKMHKKASLTLQTIVKQNNLKIIFSSNKLLSNLLYSLNKSYIHDFVIDI